MNIMLQTKDVTTHSDWVSLGNFSSYFDVTNWINRNYNPKAKAWFRMMTAKDGTSWAYFQK